MKKLVSIISFLLVAVYSQAQVATGYTFSQTATAYTPITGGAVLGNPSNDDNVFNALPIGFPFWYNGVAYSTFSANANGFIAMGNTVVSSYTSVSTGIINNLIAALNFDIQANVGVGEMRYQTIGTYPNRTLVVQWSSYRPFNSTAGEIYNFQIRLNETTNTLEAAYGSFIHPGALRTAEVGLRGNSNADFNNRQVVNGVQTWSTSVAGAVNTANCELNNTPLVPPSGLRFVWTPATSAAPTTMTFTAVTTSGMTVNWLDNSTDETSFALFNSTDNVNFNYVASVASVSTPTTGNPYNYVATGLSSNTLYYWRVMAVNMAPGSPLSGQQATLPGTMCGTYTIGPTGAYTSLTAAIAAVQTNGINCPVIFDLQAAYVSTVETFPIVIPNLGLSSTNTITVRPEIGATNLSITSAATQTIDLSGSSYFNFDGRPGSVGTNRELTIANTSITGNAIRYINDARFNGLNFMKVRGVNTSATNGVVLFSTAIVNGNGNSNNTINNSELFDGATTPANLIYSTNIIAGTFNAQNSITNSLFYNFFSASATSSAITIANNSSAWTINNNDFYQTATRTFTAGVVHLVISATTTLGGFTISGNDIGGTAINTGGTAYTMNGAFTSRFVGINFAGGPVNSFIYNNRITNFNFTTTNTSTTVAGIWCGIVVSAGNAEIGLPTFGNQIGSTTAANQIVTSSSGNGALTVGINSSSTGTVKIEFNQIGGITANSSASTVSSSIMGINISGGTGAVLTISSNTIGSTSINNSIINAVSTGVTGGHVTGIISGATSAQTTISGNTIQNLTNQYAGTATTGQTRGIVTTSGVNTITGNTISILSNLSPQTGTGTAASVLGISQQSITVGQQIVSLNTISGLANGAAAGAVSIIGINFTNSATAPEGRVFRNNISTFASNSSGIASILGINVTGGVSRFYNNFINLGLDALSNPIVNAHQYIGINKTSATNIKFFYNTVSIAGTGVNTGVVDTYAFRRTANSTTAIDSVFNNIFSNTRSNATTGGTHYSIGINSVTQFISNANNFYGNGTGYQTGLVNATQYLTLPLWNAATSFDANSFNVNPNFVSASNLHLQNSPATPLESYAIPISGINIDIDADTRPGPVGSVNGGGTVPDIGADEFDGFPILIDMGVQSLLLPTTTGCKTATETVRVRVRNYSNTTINFAVNPVTVSSSVTGPNPQVFPNLVLSSGTLPGNATLDTIVAINYNMTAVGTYVFNANTSMTGEIVVSNNAIAPVSTVISGGTATVTPNPVCAGANVTLTVTGQTNGGSIQWQESQDNITFTNIIGATTTPYTYTTSTSQADTIWFRSLSCGLHASVSDTARIIFVTAPTTVNDTVCGQDTAYLSASGSGTLRWFTAPTAGTQVNTGTNYNAFVTATDTFYVEGTSGTPPTSHLTTLAAGNGANGNMFAITAINTVTITAFDGHTNSTTPATWQIYYRPDNYAFVVGANTNSAGWISLGTATNVPSLGTGFATPIPITFNVTIPAGLTYSFHIVTTAGPGVNYTNGTALNNVFNANTDFQFREGHGGSLFNCVNVPRVFNGRIYYNAGCSSTRTPVIAVVNPAPIMTASAASNAICNNTSTQMFANTGNPNYIFSWTPPTNLSSTTNDTVTANPTANTNYIVYATDTTTGCRTSDTVAITVGLAPTINATVNNDTICQGDTIQLNVTVPPAMAILGTGTIQNTNTSYPAPYGNFYWGARHQMLYLASELTAAGLTAGPINAMSFDVANVNASASMQGFEIKFAHTTINSITAFQSPTFTSVYTNASYTAVNGVNLHTFSTPFIWDGVSNIVIETCFNNGSFTENCSMNQSTTSFTSTVYYRADAAGVCTNNTVFASINQRANVVFYSQNNFSYSWTPVASLSNSNIINPTGAPTVPTAYIVTVTDTLNGCVSMDTVNVHVNPAPLRMLNDTSVCTVSGSYTLDAQNAGATYMWSTGATTQAILVNLTGLYYVDITTVAGCSLRDSISVTINTLPVVNLGADVTQCGDSVLLDALNVGSTYMWSTGSTAQTINADTTGIYWVDVTTPQGCTSRDSISITVNPVPAVALGVDSAQCGGSITLDAQNAGSNYLWSDNSTTQTITVNSTGTYSVVVTNMQGCSSSDTVNVTINTIPLFTLGNDSAQCAGSITIAGPVGANNSYLWSDNSTNDSLTVNTSGSYSLSVTDTVTGCSYSDTIIITINQFPIVALGNDTTVCGQVTLDAQNAGSTYLWSNNAASQTITVNTTGTYFVTVTNIGGCSSSDTISVTVNAIPNATLTIPPANDTVCLNWPTFALTGGSPNGGSYFGQGVSSNMFNPNSAGVGIHTISYVFTNTAGCSDTASALIVVSACTGVEETIVMGNMQLFPNPSNGNVTIIINNSTRSGYIVEVTDVQGQYVYNEKFEDTNSTVTKQIDLSQLANGIYYIKLNDGVISRISKIAIQK